MKNMSQLGATFSTSSLSPSERHERAEYVQRMQMAKQINGYDRLRKGSKKSGYNKSVDFGGREMGQDLFLGPP